VEEIETKRKQLEELSKEELIERLARYEVIWDRMDDGTKWWLNHIYSLVRVTRRDYKPIMGALMAVTLEPLYIDIWVETKIKEYSENKTYEERKLVRLKPKELVDFEIIFERKVIEEEEKPTY